MRETIVQKIAHFIGAPEYQVELWDHHLVDYFLRNPERFHAFVDASALRQHHIWFDSYRYSKGLSSPAKV